MTLKFPIYHFCLFPDYETGHRLNPFHVLDDCGGDSGDGVLLGDVDSWVGGCGAPSREFVKGVMSTGDSRGIGVPGELGMCWNSWMGSYGEVGGCCCCRDLNH